MKLHDAIKKGDVTKVEELLVEGADPNGLDPNGNPLIFLAVEFGNVSIVKELMGAGADLSQVDFSGFTPLDLAEFNHHTMLISTLRGTTSGEANTLEI